MLIFSFCVFLLDLVVIIIVLFKLWELYNVVVVVFFNIDIVLKLLGFKFFNLLL